ncbi:MAG TPA: shikimate kinase [Planctomycetota bacterium]|jgi:shikimate kinase|nr:shikimate kinase [Planctomycetota bacterium]
MNVVLIGFRGSGKTTVGKALAARLGREFIDCDEHIERKTHLTIREIFERWGESHFRNLESEAIADLAKLDGKVIATGGGAVLRYKNIQMLKRNAKIFHLEVNPENAFRRIEADGSTRQRRPALTEKDPFTEIREQIELRRPYYLQGADVTIATDGRSVEEIVREILGHLGMPSPGGRPDEESRGMDEATA